jgi:sugar lactone lactonase YvrE
LRFAAQQKPHRPGIAPALGLRAGTDVTPRTADRAKEQTMKSLLSLLLSRTLSDSPRRTGGLTSRRSPRREARRRVGPFRPYLEKFEDRTVPTAVALPSNAVSWWTANSTANDALGLNNATLTGVTYATGEVGKAFSFNGVNSSAKVVDSSSLAFTSSFTIEGWIKVNALPASGSHGEIIFRGADGGPSPYSLSVEPNGNLSFQIVGSQTNSVFPSAVIEAPISTGQWMHVAATLDDATGLESLYVNGTLAAQITTDVRPFATLNSSGNPGVGIGNSNDPTSYNVPFNGLIDELSVYNRALTPGEVLGIDKAANSGKVLSSIAVSNPSVVEGTAGTTQAETFTLTRTGSTTGSLSVSWATADDTAKAGTDYVGASGTISFADGQATATVSVTVNGSSTDGPNKDFELIATPSGGTSVLGVATIQNANSAVSVSDASATEGNTTIRYFDDFVPEQARLSARWFAFGPDGNLYVASRATNQVLEYDGKTGAYLGVIIPAGADPSGTNPLHRPWPLTFGPDGNLYVAGVLSGNVLRYNMTTGAIDEFVPSSAGVYEPKGLAFDSAGDLLVSCGDAGGSDTSPLRDEVLRFQGPNGTSPGASLPAPGQTGAVFVASGSGGLAQSGGLAFGPDGNLYVASFRTNSVNEYDGTTGASLGTFISSSSGGLNGPDFVAFRPDGLYVACQNGGAVNRYNATTGAYLNTVVPSSSSDTDADGMAWDATGNLYVGCSFFTNFQTAIRRYGVASQEAFTVSLDYANANPITVGYATVDGSATAGTNYAAASGTVVFAPGETSKTILVPTLDDGVADPTRAFTVSLSSPVNATPGRSQGMGTILDDTKFYVVDGSSSDSTYQYASSGTALGNNALGGGDTAPRGVATTAAGTTEWVVDANKTVYVYSTGGALLGSWSAGGLGSSATLTGIATNGTDIWLVDSSAAKVYKYSGAASLLSGSQTAASSFSLVGGHNGNANPQDLVTDGTSFWVVDGTVHKVFKYTLSGSSLGSWTIDPANAHPTGITINPSNVSDIWIVDSSTLKVYQYVAAAGRTSGSQNAAATFALAAGDTNPQGLADPPPADLLLSTAAVPQSVRDLPGPSAFPEVDGSRLLAPTPWAHAVGLLLGEPAGAGRQIPSTLGATERGDPSADSVQDGVLTAEPYQRPMAEPWADDAGVRDRFFAGGSFMTEPDGFWGDVLEGLWNVDRERGPQPRG